MILFLVSLFIKDRAKAILFKDKWGWLIGFIGGAIAIIAAVVSFFIWLHFHDQKTIKACEARLQAQTDRQSIIIRNKQDEILRPDTDALVDSLQRGTF